MIHAEQIQQKETEEKNAQTQLTHCMKWFFSNRIDAKTHIFIYCIKKNKSTVKVLDVNVTRIYRTI